MSVEYNDFATRDARLVILRALHAQTDGRLNEVILLAELDRFGHRRSREWVRTQIEALRELGAVAVNEAGSVKIAAITRLGIDHVERRIVIDGVDKPSPVN